jgi:hypothetical protein
MKSPPHETMHPPSYKLPSTMWEFFSAQKNKNKNKNPQKSCGL